MSTSSLQYRENTEKEQSRIDVTYNLFKATGQVLFPENKSIYEGLAERLKGKTILEAGCGIGLGTAMLDRHNYVIGTDKLGENVALAKALYPWINFHVCDIAVAIPHGQDVTICIDVVEHIKDYRQAIKHLVASAEEAWISTPNRNNPGHGQDRPNNDFHVREFFPYQMLEMIDRPDVELYAWDTFEKVGVDTMSTPLLYKI